MLKLGMADTPLTRALFERIVVPDGLEVEFQSEFGGGLSNTGERHRRILAGELDGGEFSTASFLLARARGVALTALPVFLARGFRHRFLFCHEHSSVQQPSDLAHKRVTVHRYNSTTAVWAKGLLQNQYGVSPGSIAWMVAEDDLPGEAAPPNVTLKRIPPPLTREHAVEMLRRGEVEGALEPYVKPGPGIRRILPEYPAEEARYFRETGVFPIIHTLVVNEARLRENPSAARSLYDAFCRSAAAASRFRTEAERAEIDRVGRMIGQDPYTHRLGPSERAALSALSGYLVQQGVIHSPPNWESAFWDG